DTKELLARIRVMTRQTAVQTDSTLCVGNLTLDVATYDMKGPDGQFKLAGKEFQMLEMLMRNPKRLLSTDAFMDRIWGFESEAEQNVVWVYISYLRKKLEAVGANVKIKAQRGVGYYLEVSE
ncbi:MAG: response regulator transcription factor, partial [Clostridia bacterium]|nr:response regulator transcription factor [Clostridia bacterium]